MPSQPLPPPIPDDVFATLAELPPRRQRRAVDPDPDPEPEADPEWSPPENARWITVDGKRYGWVEGEGVRCPCCSHDQAQHANGADADTATWIRSVLHQVKLRAACARTERLLEDDGNPLPEDLQLLREAVRPHLPKREPRIYRVH